MQETDNHTKMTQFRKMPKFHTDICTNFHRLHKIRKKKLLNTSISFCKATNSPAFFSRTCGEMKRGHLK